MIADANNFDVQEQVVLEKFEGKPHPDNLIERVYILNGEVVQHDFVEKGEVVASYDSLQGGEELDAAN